MQPDTIIVVTAFALAVITAARSTWSPCGLSMLSMITPLGESSRGNRHGTTVAWFVLGAVLGGATLGAACALLAAGVAAPAPSVEVLAGIGALLAVVAIAHDVRLGGFRLPAHRRQVDEVWLTGFRPWVYGLGFGWQIGVGLATYIVTAGVYLTVALAALTASPVAAFAIGVTFGTVRGLAVLLGVRLVSPAALRAFHRRFEELGPLSMRLTTAALVGVAAVLMALVLPVPAVATFLAAAIAASVSRARSRRACAEAPAAEDPAPTTPSPSPSRVAEPV